MSLTVEQQKELAQFPPALRALVELELAAGNSIVEVGHSFPAPPAGAYFKLAKKVSTRPRRSGSGLDFYDRNSSVYSGEFADAKRFYFVLEPPNPPPPEPDMDAIRNAGAAKADEPTKGPQLSPQSVLQSSTPTSAAWLLHFRDQRPPQEIQFGLERDLMTLMRPSTEAGKLVYRANVKMTGAPYSFQLTFEAALPRTNCYSLRVEASWAEVAATHHDYYHKTSGSWFDFWTRGFQRASPPPVDEGSAERYQRLAEAALNAETHLHDVDAIQQTILAAMKRGASFATAHKEGGTNISWQNGRFVRSDYGESEERKEFASDVEFLKFLRQFYDWETSRNAYPGKVSDLEAWKLILRLLRTK